ncbi:hypothetical protein MTX35_24975 [Rhodococcus sp. ARC_M12]|uniref:hypothetical protein n=1 Tax=Rhodococcus sp. ARC_M12 TaxID=2928854 RepID=UPI001FB29961|nr:hypothetical protein [Rhodococcus sp. ARC_M12]MCJ0980958.1 hypothetical protein [Rhodococcus sp. ARC_M12]
MSNYVEDLLSGDALLTDLDDYVERWHEAPEDDDAAELELHEYLGLTWEEYQTITERPHALRFVVAARKHKTPLSEDLLNMDSEGELIAARGTGSDAKDLYDYLVSKRRVH